jgi:hypothetical protein
MKLFLKKPEITANDVLRVLLIFRHPRQSFGLLESRRPGEAVHPGDDLVQVW